jgi:hypothetical protein
MPAGRSSGWIDWDEAWKRHGGPDAAITRLVPDPFAEPVQLPWLGTSIDKTPLDIDVAGRGRDVCVRLSMGDRDVEIAPDMAHDMTRALWAAADAAEKGTT